MTDDEMMGLLVRLDERTERMETDVAKLMHVVCEGNGSPALTVQVARIDERVTAVEKSGETVEMSRRAKVGIVVAAITAAGGIIAAALQYL